MAESARFDLGSLSGLEIGGVRIVSYPGAPPKCSILVVRTTHGVRAYWNVCQHLPVPLDSGLGYLPHHDLLVCQTHGARFTKDDGLCVWGPCRGRMLDAIAVDVDAEHDRIFGRINS
jgi:nitrite reductase/ring-hydroxylating ferredoxin subunit